MPGVSAIQSKAKPKVVKVQFSEISKLVKMGQYAGFYLTPIRGFIDVSEKVCKKRIKQSGLNIIIINS